MPDTEALSFIGTKADEVRELAAGIFDKAERVAVLNFVQAAEKVAAERIKAKAKALS